MSALDLKAAVCDIVGANVTDVSSVRREPLDYDAFLAGRSLARVSGTASVDGDARPWSFIEKVTERPGFASAYLYDNGLRELRAYASGLLADLAPGVDAPRPHALEQAADGTLTLWLEDVRGQEPWTVDTFVTAAGSLGRMAGRWLGRVPDDPWLFTDWIERHSQSPAVAGGLAVLDEASNRRDIAERIGRDAGTFRFVIEGQAIYRSILERLPQTLCHHDAVRANVFARGPQGGSGIVLIDWEMVGPGAVGADLASLLFASVRRGDLDASWLEELEPRAMGAYLDGLEVMHGPVDAGVVGLGFAAAIGLRWTLIRDIVSALLEGRDIRRGSAPDEPPEAAMEQLLSLTRTLYRCADTVRRHTA